MNDATDLAKEYADAGVDLEELEGANQDTPEEPEAPKGDEPEEPKEEPKEDPNPDPEPKKDDDPEPEPKKDDEPLQAPKEQKPRSIYDDYKDKKNEAKDFRSLATELLKSQGIEVTGNETPDELRAKISAGKPETPKEEAKAATDLEAFAKEIGTDPQILERMRDLFFKDSAPGGLSPEDKAELESLREFKQTYSEQMVKQQFEQEYQSVAPTIEETFPQATEAEKSAIKDAVDKLAHSKEWHDKSLDYVVFKNKDQLNALVSPKKRGLEPRDRKDVDAPTTEFDPNPDFSKMTEKQMQEWQQEYDKITNADGGLDRDSEGRLMI